MDLAVSNYGNASVTILKNNGGTFSVAQTIPNIFANPEFIAVANFDRDVGGRLDLAVANHNGGAGGKGSVVVLKNNSSGAGNFNFTQLGSTITTGAFTNGIATGNFDGVNGPDLVATNINDNTVSVLLNDGSGGFTPAAGSPVAVGVFPLTVGVADFYGDGIADFVTANTGSTSLPATPSALWATAMAPSRPENV